MPQGCHWYSKSNAKEVLGSCYWNSKTLTGLDICFTSKGQIVDQKVYLSFSITGKNCENKHKLIDFG